MSNSKLTRRKWSGYRVAAIVDDFIVTDPEEYRFIAYKHAFAYAMTWMWRKKTIAAVLIWSEKSHIVIKRKWVEVNMPAKKWFSPCT